MKEKLKIAFLTIICLIYLLISYDRSQKEWLNGINKEEEKQEDTLVW